MTVFPEEKAKQIDGMLFGTCWAIILPDGMTPACELKMQVPLNDEL